MSRRSRRRPFVAVVLFRQESTRSVEGHTPNETFVDVTPVRAVGHAPKQTLTVSYCQPLYVVP